MLAVTVQELASFTQKLIAWNQLFLFSPKLEVQSTQLCMVEAQHLSIPAPSSVQARLRPRLFKLLHMSLMSEQNLNADKL